MNKFYYIEDYEVKEFDTVKDLEFIKKVKGIKAAKKKGDLVLPEGYVLNGNKVEPTEEKQAEIDAALAEQEHEALLWAEMRRIAQESLDSQK